MSTHHTEERDLAADNFVNESPKYSGYPEHMITFKAGWDAVLLESSTVKGLVDFIKKDKCACKYKPYTHQYFFECERCLQLKAYELARKEIK